MTTYTQHILGSEADTTKNLMLRADNTNGGGSICKGDGTELIKVPAGGIPAFRAYATGVTSVAASDTKIALAGETFDTANAFDSVTNSRFQPQVAGYYQITGHVRFGSASYNVQVSIYKNGAATTYGGGGFGASSYGDVVDLIYLNGSSDYVELFAASGTTQNTSSGTSLVYFSGILIKAA